MFNPIRIEYILEEISKHFKLNRNKKHFLKNLEILDIGCGGGLISEPMARLGGNITGIDASEKNIKVAVENNIFGTLNLINSLNKNVKSLTIISLFIIEYRYHYFTTKHEKIVNYFLHNQKKEKRLKPGT